MTDKRSTTIPLTAARPSLRQQKVRRDRLFLVGTVLVVVVAWIIGYRTSGADIAPLAAEILPGATQVRQEGQLYIGLNGEGQIVGYAAAAGAPGYSGPIEMLVAIDPAGQIQGVQVVSQSESPGFFRLVTGSDLLEDYSQKAFDDPLQLDEDLDAVSGATLSAEGVAAAVRLAVRQIAEEGLDTTLPPEKQPVQIGGPEIVLVLLFIAGYVGHRWRNGVWKRRVRWATLISGMLLLGFLYTVPLTIAMIIALLSGYWPDWHNNLYWYMLIGGIIFVTTVEAKNPYCHWFCPFGASQECLAAATRVKPYYARDLTEPLKWLQRLLALTAIVLGLVLRRPGVASYEPFATLFDFRGTTIAWIFLIVVIFASLLTYRPFCRYLCPLDPVVDFIATGRRWIKETWTRWRQMTVKS